MSANMAAKLLTLLTLAEVWLKMGAYCADDLARAHKDMKDSLDFPRCGVVSDFYRLVNRAEIWRELADVEEVARCHAEMRALLEGVPAHG
jgi:hypothetical protein